MHGGAPRDAAMTPRAETHREEGARGQNSKQGGGGREHQDKSEQETIEWHMLYVPGQC